MKRKINFKRRTIDRSPLPMFGDKSAPVYVVVDPYVGNPSFDKPLSSDVTKWFISRLKEYGKFRKEDICIIAAAPAVTPDTWRQGRLVNEHLKKHRYKLTYLIDKNEPKFIMPFGAKACQQVLGHAVKITKVRGQPIQNDDILGGIPVLPMLSPFYAQRQPENESVFNADLATAARIFKAGFNIESSAIDYNKDYKWCYDLSFLFDIQPELISIDFETLGLDPRDKNFRLLTAQISWEEGKAVSVPIDYDYEDLAHFNFIPWDKIDRTKLLSQIKHLVKSPKIKKTGHNLKFDYMACKYGLGINMGGYAHDTSLLAHLLDENSYKLNLSDLIRRYIPEMSGFNDLHDNDPEHHGKSRMDLFSPDKMLDYGCGDVDASLRLAHILLDEVKEDPKLYACYQHVTMPAQRAFCHIEPTGFHISKKKLREFEKELKVSQKILRIKLLKNIPKEIKNKHRNTGVGLKPTRAAILVDWLYEHEKGLKLKPVLYTKTGQPSVSSKLALPYYVADHSILSDLITYIKNEKLLSTYVKGFYKYIQDGKICPSYSLTKTVTGRSQSERPNGQNFPKRGKLAKKYREIFIAPKGWVYVQTDLSQAELRIAAMMSGDPVMLEVYLSGGDIHKTTAANIMGLSLEEFDKLPEEVKGLKRFQAKCYSGDTEILTDIGFVRLDSLPKSAKVAQWEPSGAVEFVTPIEYHEYKNQRTLHISDGNTDLVVTENHRLPLFSRYTGNMHVTEAGRLDSNEKVGSTLSAHAGIMPDSKFADALLTRFMVMVQADGSYTPEGGIRFGFSKKRKIAECRKLLKLSQAQYSERVDYSTTPAVTTFQIPASDPVALSIRGWMPDKQFSPALLDVIDKEAFLAELPKWDGHIYKNSCRGLVNYTNNSKQSVDFAQMVCALSGRTSNIHKNGRNYILSYRRDEHNDKKRNNWSVEQAPIQDVYSVSVPSTFIIVRRNGHVTVSGNSINFGFIYGMWWVKFRAYAKTEYGIEFTDDEAREIREIFFRTYTGLESWHRDCQDIVRNNGQIRTYDGRIRHLPNVYSPDEAISKAAIRQGINSPVQAIASDLGLMSLGRLIPYIKRNKLDWIKICGFVHDSIVALVREDRVAEGATIIKTHMENNPLEKWFNWKPEIPILADVEIGRDLSNTYELKEKHFYNKKSSYLDIITAILNEKEQALEKATNKDVIESLTKDIDFIKADMAISKRYAALRKRPKLAKIAI